MSVVNLSVSPSRILILSDTLQYRGREPVSFCERKTFICTAGGYAHTLRGSAAVGDFLGSYLEKVPTMHEAVGAVSGTFSALEADTLGDGIEATLAGMYYGQLAAVRVRLKPGMAAPDVSDIPCGVHLAPAGDIPLALPPQADDALMIRLALAQWKVQDRFSLPLCIGGLMHLTAVTADGVRQWTGGEYPDYADMRARLPGPRWMVQQAAA